MGRRARRCWSDRSGRTGRPTTRWCARSATATIARSRSSTPATSAGSRATSTAWSRTTAAPRTSRRRCSSRRCGACAQTERPIAFKPWIYEIAKNACIDAYRRGRRAEEVSFDADDRLSAADHGRLVASDPGPDAAVDTKQDLDHLCGAFGGLSDTHHEILVMRELEGLSYKDIGERMGMSRPAVESTLFRARKRLGEEYDELASGARCLRIQGIIAEADARARRCSGCATSASSRATSRTASRAGASPRTPGSTSPIPVRTRVARQARRPAPAARVPAAAARRRRSRCGSGGGRRRLGLTALPASPSAGAGWGKATQVTATLATGAARTTRPTADGATARRRRRARPRRP